jgi:hypothetical protein
MNELALIGTITGTIGITLGIINLIYSVLDRSTRLTVVFKVSWRMQGGFFSIRCSSLKDSVERIRNVRQQGFGLFPAIEVINHSKHTVTIDEVGFKISRKHNANRALLQIGETLPNMNPPYRVEPLSSIAFFMTGYDITELPHGRFAYAATADDRYFYASLRCFIETIQAIEERHV